MASMRFTCPPTWLAQVGLLASSKSAMKPLAPELSALMTSLRSVGPVISTRGCSSSNLAVGGRGNLDAAFLVVRPRRPPLPVGLADLARLLEEVERAALA